MRLLVRLFRRKGGFTLIELLTVMAVIAILAALVLSISGFAEKKAALGRAQVELKTLENACESYKADNGTYPYLLVSNGTAQAATVSGVAGGSSFTSNIPSDNLYPAGPNASGVSNYQTGTPYAKASLELYEALTGDFGLTGTSGALGTKNYIPEFRPDAFGRSLPNSAVSGANPVQYFSDPFGNCYGYSTACATASALGVTGTYGYNATFDLWSTGGQINNGSGTATLGSGQAGDPMLQWVKNW
jgi:general secretion pathway protein G